MDWAVGEEDERTEIGCSDLAMDFIVPSSLSIKETHEALRRDVFLRSVAPPDYHLEIRHDPGGGPLNIGLVLESHLLIQLLSAVYAMKKSSLLPNDDALLIVRAESPSLSAIWNH